MKNLILAVLILLSVIPVSGQSKQPASQAVPPVTTEAQKVLQNVSVPIKPDAAWLEEYQETLALNTQVEKINSETGYEKLKQLRENLSQDLLNRIPKGYHFDQSKVSFVQDATPEVKPPAVEKESTEKP